MRDLSSLAQGLNLCPLQWENRLLTTRDDPLSLGEGVTHPHMMEIS